MTRPPLPRRPGAAALVLLVALLLAGCADYGPLRELEALPESDLPPYPGAELLGESSQPQRPGISVPDHAKIIRRFRADATREQVIAYYDDLLVPLGWDGIGSTGEWYRGDLNVKIFDAYPPLNTPSYAWEEWLVNSP